MDQYGEQMMSKSTLAGIKFSSLMEESGDKEESREESKMRGQQDQKLGKGREEKISNPGRSRGDRITARSEDDDKAKAIIGDGKKPTSSAAGTV